MTQKTSIKSATWTNLDEIRTALPGIPLDDARALLHSSRARFISSKALAAEGKRAAARLAKRAIWSSCDDATVECKTSAPVFAKRTKRISGEVADHTQRLSDSRTDTALIKEFLANGGNITVVPTRNAPGTKAQRMHAKFGSSISSGARSRKAHSKVARDAADARRS